MTKTENGVSLATGPARKSLLNRLLGKDTHVVSDGEILARYFQAPSDRFIASIQGSRVRYVGAQMPSDERYRYFLRVGRPCEGTNLTRDLDRITRFAAMTPLLKALEPDFRGREIVLQGVACSVGPRIEVPESDGRPSYDVKPVWRLASPTVSDTPTPAVVDVTRSGVSLADQNLMSIPEMYGKASHARARVNPEQRVLIHPALVVYDKDQVQVNPMQPQIAKDNGKSALQSRTLTLPFGNAARERAILGVYVVDYPRYAISGS
ncbi:MAG: hypothetical protein HY344_02220 [Candidatus Levybacteria bacterium]|nr:hypothetical protein [Candidatus Levybacteria bacterium]